MKKIIIYCLTLVLFSSSVYSQKKKITAESHSNMGIKIIYTARPYSQDFFQLMSDLLLAQVGEEIKDEYMPKIKNIKRFYNLYSDFNSSKSVCFLERTENVVPTYSVPTFLCSLKNNDDYYGTELFYNNKVYTKSNKPMNYDWKIIEGETKEISTFKCQKAISNIDGYEIVVWFTTEIPISNGPMNIYDLPGMLVLATDYYNSFALESIEIKKTIKKELNEKYEELIAKYEKEKEKKEVADANVFFHQKLRDYKDMKKEIKQQIENAGE